VVDQLPTAPEDPRETPLRRDQGGQVPQPPAVALVEPVEAAGADLGARRAGEDLGGGGVGLVVEVPDHGEAAGAALAAEQAGGQRPDGRGLGGGGAGRRRRRGRTPATT
jgi:hypothetical protein